MPYHNKQHIFVFKAGAYYKARVEVTDSGTHVGLLQYLITGVKRFYSSDRAADVSNKTLCHGNLIHFTAGLSSVASIYKPFADDIVL